MKTEPRDTSFSKPASTLESLATLALSVRYEELPAAVVSKTKALLLDTLGCAYGGLASDVVRATRAVADECGGAPHASLFGGGRSSMPLATFVNGSALRYLDSNDYYFARDPAHPSGNVAVALAVGEYKRCSGRELIAALVAAYEVHLRLCDFAGEPSLWKRGWHHGTNVAFSSSALASRLLGADALHTAHAMAIAGSHQNTLAQLQSGAVSMIKATAEAWVAKAGVEAALLAGQGVTGPLPLFEGQNGWAITVAGGVDLAALTAPLEGHYRLSDVSIKPYPVVATAVAPVSAAIEVHRAGLPPLTQIDKLIVKLPAFALATPSAAAERRYPTHIESAQHSFYYCVAIALIDGACGDAQFTPEKLASQSVRELLAKVELREEPSFSAQWPQTAGGGIELQLRDGSVRRYDSAYPLGHPRCPLGDDELAAKFYEHADGALTRPCAEKLRAAVDQLEACPDLREFAALFGGEAP